MIGGTAPTVAEIEWLEAIVERFFPRRVSHGLIPVESPWFAARRPRALPPPIVLPQLPPPGETGFPWFG